MNGNSDGRKMRLYYPNSTTPENSVNPMTGGDWDQDEDLTPLPISAPHDWNDYNNYLLNGGDLEYADWKAQNPVCRNCRHWWSHNKPEAKFDYCELGLQAGDDCHPNATFADATCEQFEVAGGGQ